jgi:hypothetical protein
MIHRTRLPAQVIASPARNVDCEAEHTWLPRFELKPEQRLRYMVRWALGDSTESRMALSAIQIKGSPKN